MTTTSADDGTTTVIRDVRALFSTAATWTAGAYARDAGDKERSPNDPQACRWCLIGAIMHCTPAPYPADALAANVSLRMRVYYRLARAAGMPPGTLTLATLNDQGGHGRVVEVLDKALIDGG